MKKITLKQIKDMCGTVSYKKGDAFYRTNKITFIESTPEKYKAVVSAKDDFHVLIEFNELNKLTTTCTCPKLSSFQKECQHVAAVLIAVHDEQNKSPIVQEISHGSNDQLQSLFSHNSSRPARYRSRFENRQTVELQLLCDLHIGEQTLIRIEIELDGVKVNNIREFLLDLENGIPHTLSSNFTFNTFFHCFTREDEAVLQQFIQIGKDEKFISESYIIIPPSHWEQMKVLLQEAPLVKVIEKPFSLTSDILPLRFHLTEAKNHSYVLQVEGLEKIMILDPYSTVLYNGELIDFERSDFNLLLDLRKLLKDSSVIQVPKKQLSSFIEKVVPGLRKLGVVQLSSTIVNEVNEAPLVAKLFLDRIKNRLLIGLEFQYENIILNPLDDTDDASSYVLVRDIEKEQTILRLLDESECTKTDGGFYLHNEALEYEFLYYIVPKLQKLTQIYATTAVRNRIFRPNAKPRIRVKVNKERTNWLDFKFKMDGIAEDEIRGLLSAIEEKRKYYRLKSGSLFSLETKEIKEIQRFLTTIPEETDIHEGISLPITKSAKYLSIFGEHDAYEAETTFKEFLSALHSPSKLDFDVPTVLQDTLRDYQKLGFNWMKTLSSYGFGGVLADDMGLGKTLQSIAFISSELPSIRTKKLPVLIVCPSSLTYNWLAEFGKFTPDIQVIVIDGEKKARAEIQSDVTEYDVLITSYPLLRADIDWYEKRAFHTIFFDEAQAFKNATTQTAKAAKKLQAENRFALTGTPVENSPEELWSIYHIVFPELFQGLFEFSYLTSKDIAKRIRPFLLRRLKEDVLHELPDKNETTESIDLSKDQKELYAGYLAKLRHDTLKHLDKETLRKNRIKILAGLTRLRQICCHPGLFVDGYKGKSSKLEQLLEIIEECKHSGRKVLIFSQFTKMLQIIGQSLTKQGLPYFYLDGQTPSEERLELCNRFNDGERSFFLISLKAGGTGLNLTGADTVILYDSWWNPAVEEQAMDRAHRIGQSNVVHVIKLVTKGTIEEKINELQEKKRQMIEEIMDTEGKQGYKLSDEDIREILNI
ncbi:DEAD/DEAH box helicase [Bacillus suaedaesalsae]|uniref:DEAD/DEAH box helicase n=1 Tax=Bacillus suaedaesalsae TaxID=2810349 RepID=A0ABS2DDC7_9BACI|nr:DEAD/DEAH box helicase [Bacillus suaedaesalsae]MBM6616457.1 DEAD/DEAH box helicase [Bacillus suaedaesalsae]